MKKDILKIQNLHVEAEDKKILKGVNLTIRSNEIHAVMGPNGSGKSTLVNAIMGHPRFRITKGKITFNGKDITKLSTDKRAKLGLFLSFQQPMEIPGVNFGSFLRQAKTPRLDPVNFLKLLNEKSALLGLNEKFTNRNLNEGFSGGEKKKGEILQMAVLEPRIAMLDEIDSGLDIDSLKTVAKAIKEIHKKSKLGLLLITHYQRILSFVTPDFVHILSQGKIIKSGNHALAKKIEKKGYAHINN